MTLALAQSETLLAPEFKGLSFDEESHRYFLYGKPLPGVTSVLKDVGFVDDRFYTEEGRIRGQAVHLATHYYDTGVLDPESLHPKIQGYFEAYLRFLRETKFQVVFSESRVCHRDFRYAGTNDKVGFLFGRPALVDIKTGDIAFWAAFQLAAYAACYPYPLARYGLRLFPDGRYKLIPFEDKNDFSVFLAALTTANVKTQQQKKGGLQ